MYTNLKKAGLGDFRDEWYWSSSQLYYSDGYNFAKKLDFSDGEQREDDVSETFAVRAIRAF